VPNAAATAALAERLNDALPQTQCTRCGYADCRAYAQAIADGDADINRCPPGGAEGVTRLAALANKPVLPLDPACGNEGARALAVIDEAWCIGCTLCIKACPVDCIVGASKLMHTVIDELCIPVCPVDCIQLVDVTGELTGWDAWSPALAAQARQRYAEHVARTERERHEHDELLAETAAARLSELQTRQADPEAITRKQALVDAAMARARASRSS